LAGLALREEALEAGVQVAAEAVAAEVAAVAAVAALLAA